MIQVKVDYLTLPDRHRKTETVSLDSDSVGCAAVIEALKASDFSARVAERLALTRLQISGPNVTIGKRQNPSVRQSAGEGFQDNDRLWEVIIDATRWTIGTDAFRGCKSLKSVILSDGGQSIGDFAFCDCEHLESIAFPDSITSIGKCAFSGCQSLNRIILPPRLNTIGESAFSKTNLQAAVLPSSVSSIGARSFSSCKRLQYAVIPSSINMNRLAGESFPFVDCDYKRLIIVCNQTEYDSHKDFSFSDNAPSFSKGLRYRWKTTPNTLAGVGLLVRTRAVAKECRDNAREIARSAPIRGKFDEARQDLDDAESLKVYLKLVSDAETTVLQLSEALALAKTKRKLVEIAVERRRSFDRFKAMVDVETERDREERERRIYEQKRRDISAGKYLPDSIVSNKPNVDPRSAPEPRKPERPVPQKPGLFNRRRVEAKNAKLESQYKEALAHYEALMTERAGMIADYDEKLAAWKQERKEYIQRQLDDFGAFKASSVATKANGSADVTQELEAAESTMDAMCAELQAHLSEVSGLLKLAYSADIIFPKYRNIEAMTTMWEYLESGRCDSLQGPSGAYNLYESEIRSNAIINRLDVVSDKLDVIINQLSSLQANQYALYAAVEGIGKRLDSMSRTLDSIFAETKAVKGSVQNLDAKATALVRNSSEIAYWTRKNAELTDSLGYLIAFTAM